MRIQTTAFLQLAGFAIVIFISVTSGDALPHVTTMGLEVSPGSTPTASAVPITRLCVYDTSYAPKLVVQRGYPRNAFTDITGWKLLRNCAQACLDGNTGGYYYGIWDFSNCADNGCACRADNQPTVVRSLSSCISKDCGASDTVDYIGATSVYAIFCSSVTGAPPTDMLPTASIDKTIIVPTTVVSTMTVRTSTSRPSSECCFLLLCLMVTLSTTILQFLL